MRIARVFPTKTSFSPTDKDAYFDAPDMFTPQYDEVHISVTFTWDIEKATRLGVAWEKHGKVLYGGVAIDGESTEPFKAGMYLRPGITITSRGCPNNCWFCMVKNPLKEFDDFPEGNIVQDNNFFACSDYHQQKGFKMLRNQKRIEFKGGLEAARITPKIAEELRGLSIRTLWLACDHPNAIKPLEKAVRILYKAGFTRSHLCCYALIGNDRGENEERLRKIWDIGCMPFAQLLRNKQDDIVYSKDWKRFHRTWSRPAATRAEAKTKSYVHR